MDIMEVRLRVGVGVVGEWAFFICLLACFSSVFFWIRRLRVFVGGIQCLGTYDVFMYVCLPL